VFHNYANVSAADASLSHWSRIGSVDSTKWLNGDAKDAKRRDWHVDRRGRI